VVDGIPAWEESGWVGATIAIGEAALDVFKRTERCAATNVDPETGRRDMAIPAVLQRTWGHTDFGVYARIAADGVAKLGDPVAVLSAAAGGIDRQIRV
jgi:uncharacterized protein YcbX